MNADQNCNMNNTIHQATGLFEALYNNTKPSQLVYRVKIKDKPAGECYLSSPFDKYFCQHCIDEAINIALLSHFDQRLILIGQITEAKNTGYYYTTEMPGKKDENDIPVRRVVKVPCTPDEIGTMIQALQQVYDVTTEFEPECTVWDDKNETNDVLRCQSCYTAFRSTLVITDDELKQWEEYDDETLSHAIVCPNCGYNIFMILTAPNVADFLERVTDFASRIIQLSIDGKTEMEE